MHPAPNPPAGGAEPAAWSLAPLARLPPAKKGISAAEKKIVRAVGRGRGGRGRGRGRLVGSGSGGGGGGGTPRAPGGGRTKLVAVLAKHARCGGPPQTWTVQRTMALIASDCGAVRSLRTKWPESPRVAFRVGEAAVAHPHTHVG